MTSKSDQKGAWGNKCHVRLRVHETPPDEAPGALETNIVLDLKIPDPFQRPVCVPGRFCDLQNHHTNTETSVDIHHSYPQCYNHSSHIHRNHQGSGAIALCLLELVLLAN